jgi:hypothetical protein
MGLAAAEAGPRQPPAAEAASKPGSPPVNPVFSLSTPLSLLTPVGVGCRRCGATLRVWCATSVWAWYACRCAASCRSTQSCGEGSTWRYARQFPRVEHGF